MKKKRKFKKKKAFNLHGYIFGALRKIWRWYPERKIALDLAKVYISNKELYTCAKCDKIFTRKQVHIDHLNPVISPITGFTSWDSYIQRLFVSHNHLQVLCKDCHQLKTQAENKLRRK